MWAEMPNILTNITFELPLLKNSYHSVLHSLLMPGALKGPSGRVGQGGAKEHENVLERVLQNTTI